jgi:hypothetical protein
MIGGASGAPHLSSDLPGISELRRSFLQLAQAQQALLARIGARDLEENYDPSQRDEEQAEYEFGDEELNED